MIPYCPVFSPTLEEFRDFAAFVTKARGLEPTAPMIKIQAPADWTPRGDHYQSLDLIVNHPVRQEIYGQTGKYQIALVSQRKLTLAKYRERAVASDKMTEGMSEDKVETLFWKSITFKNPIYGSDTDIETLFDQGVPWNLAELQSDLKVGLGENKLAGIVTPYLYVGAWKTLFAWHCEDFNLPAINYLHFGKPKFWYAIDPADVEKFEAFASKSFPEAAAACPEFLRHKCTLISPYLLLKQGIHVTKTVQREREFILVFERVYHAGFNFGYNAAESVNFAMENWVEIGKQARVCRCDAGNVKINMRTFEANLRKAKRTREEQDEEEATRKQQER